MFGQRRSILFRATLFSWLVIVLSITAFTSLLIPQQRAALIDEMQSKASLMASSIMQAISQAAVIEDYGPMIDHCMRVVKENPSVLYVVITRKDGFSIVHKRDGWADARLDGIWTPHSASQGSGMFFDSPLINKRVFHFTYPISYSGIEWGWLHIGLSLEKFDRDLRNVYLWTMWIFLICILGGLVLSYVFARQLTRPIVKLNEVTQRVREGDLSARADINSGDELQDLGNSLNQMTETLEKSTKSLREAKDDLAQSLKDLQEAQYQLIQAGKMSAVGQLAAGVAHEINNPLSGVLANAKLLREIVSNPNACEPETFKSFPDFLDLIIESAYRCKTIVENLLSFSRQSKKGFEELVSINEVIEKSLYLLGNELRLSSVVVNTKLAPDMKKVKGNFNRIQQVFVNLILNGLQFMPQGGEICLSTSQSPNGRLIIATVKDTGPGISPENLEKIFEPFFTTMSVSQGSKAGTGLGLSICYGIVKEHYGTIEVASEIGKGAVFTVTLPAKD